MALNSLSYTITLLLYCAFHVTALVLSLAYWKRYPNVCVLVLAGSLLNLFALGIRIAMYIFDIPFFDLMFGFGFINLGIGVVSVAGSGLYLLAIFTGRTPYTPRPPRPYEEEDWDRPAKPNSQPGSTGIKEP